MKNEYDFSKGERGKFYKPDVKINLPIYLDEKALEFIQKVANKKNSNISAVVNSLIHSDIAIAEAVV